MRRTSCLRRPELFRGEVVATGVSQRFPFDDVAIEAERGIELVRQDQAPEALREALRRFIVGRSEATLDLPSGRRRENGRKFR
jgi:hypothetical protein